MIFYDIVATRKPKQFTDPKKDTAQRSTTLFILLLGLAFIIVLSCKRKEPPIELNPAPKDTTSTSAAASQTETDLLTDTSAAAPRRLFDQYPVEKMVLTRIDKAEFDPPEKSEAPKDFLTVIQRAVVPEEIEDPDKFESDVWKGVRKLGQEPDTVGLMSTKQIVYLAMNVVMRQLAYVEVDALPFRNKHGKMALDKLFSLGVGDCDKYASLTKHVFRLLKKRAGGLRHIELTTAGEMKILESDLTEHEFNLIWVFSPDRVEIIPVDVTFADNGAALDAMDGSRYHIDREIFHAELLVELWFWSSTIALALHKGELRPSLDEIQAEINHTRLLLDRVKNPTTRLMLQKHETDLADYARLIRR